ncbi:MAG: hypothetical protein JXK05_08115 [Campylobacterales bacterium]|nr:hypothetical protein [Campylobacterales bacterium]
MIYQDTIRFLKQHLGQATSSDHWNARLNLQFLLFLQSRYGDTEIRKETHEIKEAFGFFFESVGMLIFEFSLEQGVVFTLHPYQIEPYQSRHLASLIGIIQSRRRDVIFPYQQRNDQMALTGPIRRAVNALIATTDESVNKKELIRLAIRKALLLDDRDLILIQKRKYLVKLFLSATKSVAKPLTPDDDYHTVHSIDPKELRHHYDELFSEIDIEAFLDNVMTVLFTTSLDFDQLTNEIYEKNAIREIRQHIMKELSCYFSGNQEYVEQLSDFILRTHVLDIHKRLAIHIFEQVTLKNRNAERFLQYYSGEIYIENGNKYSIPALMTPDGKHWNTNSVASIAKMWIHARKKLKLIQIEVLNKKNTFDLQESDYRSTKAHFETLDQEYNLLAHTTQAQREELEKLRFQIYEETKEKMDPKRELELRSAEINMTKEFSRLKSKFLTLKKERDNEFYEFKNKEELYEANLKERSRLESDLKMLKQNLDINSEAYHSILSSLVKALMQRKQLIETSN